jgi:hypothetical protein
MRYCQPAFNERVHLTDPRASCTARLEKSEKNSPQFAAERVIKHSPNLSHSLPVFASSLAATNDPTMFSKPRPTTTERAWTEHQPFHQPLDLPVGATSHFVPEKIP